MPTPATTQAANASTHVIDGPGSQRRRPIQVPRVRRVLERLHLEKKLRVTANPATSKDRTPTIKPPVRPALKSFGREPPPDLGSRPPPARRRHQTGRSA